ncbi:MAG TPA: hypothetical protein VN231_10120 [Allosphingosinicella sp.]|nr:hypothetical protein [Allosphingosinicella sp.]
MSAAILILSMLAAAFAQPTGPLTFEGVRTGPPRALAERLVGSGQAADVERSEVRWDRMLPGRAELRLFHRPVPLAGDMCSQRVHYISLVLLDPTNATSLPRDRQPLRAERIRDNETIALAPNCRTVPGQSFVYLNPGVERDLVIQGLRNLAAARAAAAARGRLPFRLSCRDEAADRRDACGAGARRTLADLPTEQAWLMNGNADGVDITIGQPGELQWRVSIAGFGTDRARVSLTWFAPAPF